MQSIAVATLASQMFRASEFHTAKKVFGTYVGDHQSSELCENDSCCTRGQSWVVSWACSAHPRLEVDRGLAWLRQDDRSAMPECGKEDRRCGRIVKNNFLLHYIGSERMLLLPIAALNKDGSLTRSRLQSWGLARSPLPSHHTEGQQLKNMK